MGLFTLLFLICTHAHAALPVVKAPAGIFSGIETAEGRKFLGIPYAEPPVGDLRFAAPREKGPIAGTFEAKSFGSVCVQPKAHTLNPDAEEPSTGSEDCLFLNLYLPPTTKKNLPVMVWIHGGGLVVNSGSDFDGHFLAQKQDVIVVTLNYRLGALGFLYHPSFGEDGANLGLQDQQAALRWVAKNIEAFGGNPRNVTIFGESAGGQSVCLQLLSPGAKGLFSRAIVESGPCGENLLQSRGSSEAAGLAFAKAMGCEGKDALACLRKVPLARIATRTTGKASNLQVTPWKPTVGTAVLPGGISAFASGKFNQVPLLIGTNRNEGRLFAYLALAKGLLGNEAAYQNELRAQFGEKAKDVSALYPSRKAGSAALAFAAVNTDWLFACPSFRAAGLASAHTATYFYEFDDEKAPASLPPNPLLPSLGAFHTAELQYVFGTKWSFTDPAKFTPEQSKLASWIQEDWVNFAKSGEPSLRADSWPRFQKAKPRIRRFAPAGATQASDYSSVHHCDFWSGF